MALSFSRPKVNDKELVKKSKSQVKRGSVKGGKSISAQIQSKISMAQAKLSKYKDDFVVIRDKQELLDYLEDANKEEICAIDT